MSKNFTFPGLSYTYDIRDKEKSIANYIDYMLDRTQKFFVYTGLPETIPKRMIELYLQCNGYTTIYKHQGELYAYTSGLGGVPDVYYNPTVSIIANPAQNLNTSLTVDVDCVVIRNDSLMRGLLPIHKKYAVMLAENDISLWLADINTRIVSLISAPDDRTKKAADKYLDDVFKGRLSSIADNTFLDGIKSQPYASAAGTLKSLIEYHQYIKASWFQELGLNAAYNMKRESIGTAETALNDDILLPLVDDMLECRRIGLDKVNKMYGTNITVDLDSSWNIVNEEVNNSSQLETEGDSNNGTENTEGSDT